MLDHIFGRPSTYIRKYQVFSVVLLWSFYLTKVDRHGPPFVRSMSRWLSRRLTIHQTLVIFSVALYVSRNFARVVGLESPEPLSNLYAKDYFRATWITTALDAGFWTAMHLRPKWLRHVASIIFTLYYLVCAEQADEMVRRVRGVITVQHLRVSWNKSQTPVLRTLTRLLRPKLTRHDPFEFKIERPEESDYKEPVAAWMYFDGTKRDLKHQDKIVLDVPGGGFVAMSPPCHEDKLLAWAGKLGIPIVSLDYQKAPEAPYPYALHECYDVYYQIIKTRGKCIGLSGDVTPKIIVSGDSAGGNLAIGMVLMLINESPYSGWSHGAESEMEIPLPEAVVAIYPSLDMSIANWMTDEQLALIKQPGRKGVNKKIADRKTDDYRRLTPATPLVSDVEDDDDDPAVIERPPRQPRPEKRRSSVAPPPRMRTRLAMTSIISYFNDRILGPEMLRAMILLYIGPHNRPDFATDFLLSPLRAPENLLARFPRTFLLCGERDPLSDDTVIFAGRLRRAHFQEFRRRQELGLEPEHAAFDDRRHVETVMVEGISHGFMQFLSVYPSGWQYVHACSRWMRDRFDEVDLRAMEPRSSASNLGADYFSRVRWGGRSRRGSDTSGDERPLEIPSKLRMTSINGGGGPQRKKSSVQLKDGGGSSRSGRGRIERPAFASRRSFAAQRDRIHKLGSFEDLMKRRMVNVTERHGDEAVE